MEPKPMTTPDLSGLIKSKVRRPPVPSAPVPAAQAAPAVEQQSPSRPDREKVTRAPNPATTSAPPRPAAAPRKAPVGEERRPPAKYTRSISLYLPRSIHAALAQRAADTGQTRTAMILRAVNTHHEDLQAWLDDQGSTPVVGGLFDVPQDARATEPVVQTALRVTDAQLAAMDELASQLGVRRSHVMVAALRASLKNYR